MTRGSEIPFFPPPEGRTVFRKLVRDEFNFDNMAIDPADKAHTIRANDVCRRPVHSCVPFINKFETTKRHEALNAQISSLIVRQVNTPCSVPATRRMPEKTSPN